MNSPVPIYVTLTGLPLRLEFNWPFHKSTSGGDFYVLHGVATVADGSGQHANVSLHLTAAMLDMVESLESKDCLPVVVSAVRKVADRKELEFIKSTKLQPVQLSSRFKNLKAGTWKFEEATDEQIATVLRDRVYWAHKTGFTSVDLSEGPEAMYLAADPSRLTTIAKTLEDQGLVTLSGSIATATEKLLSLSTEIEARAARAFAAIQQKHAFEASKVG